MAKTQSLFEQTVLAITLKERIRTDIEANIFSGKWPPGYRIPNEHEFMVTYQCSRMTVNKVLTVLASIGFIERRRKAGSFVARPTIQSAILEIRDMRAEVVLRGYRYDYELRAIEHRLCNAQDHALFGSSEMTEVLDFQCLHLANSQPFAFEQRLLNVNAVPDALKQDFRVTVPGTWLLEHVPWSRAEHKISAMNADAKIGSLLKIKKGTACLNIERITWRDNDPITQVRIAFSEALYQITAQVKSPFGSP